MGRLEGKRAIITGAANGIGRGMALRFAQEGAAVGVLDVADEACNAVVAEITASGGKAIVLVADLQQVEQVETAVTSFTNRFGPPNILVNNAAVMAAGTAHTTSLDIFDRAVGVNLRGTFVINSLVIPHMLKQKQGSIVNMGSVTGVAGRLFDDQRRTNGWIEGPLAEACDLVGVSEMLLQLALDPEFSRVLLAKMVPTAKAFAQAQIEAGCNIIGMGDAICSQISPNMYVQYVKELHSEIIDFIHSQGALVKVHICGNITKLLTHLRELQPDIVDCDWMVDMDLAYETLGPGIIRSGNLDPAAVVEQLSAEAVYERTKALVERERGRPFILSGGCEITPLTPPENLMAMRTVARSS